MRARDDAHGLAGSGPRRWRSTSCAPDSLTCFWWPSASTYTMSFLGSRLSPCAARAPQLCKAPKRALVRPLQFFLYNTPPKRHGALQVSDMAPSIATWERPAQGSGCAMSRQGKAGSAGLLCYRM